MSLRASEIAAVVAELAPLAGARLEAIRVHEGKLLTLELRGRDGPATLLLSAEPDLTRIHVARRRPPPAAEPPPFQVALRRALAGGRLAAVEVQPGDRIVTLRWERREGPASVVAELTGRHGNLFLVDEAGIIRAMAGRNLSRRRLLAPGAPWTPPEPHPLSDEPRFTPVAGEPFPLSAAIEERYRALEEERAAAEARRRLREPLRAASERARRALARLAEEAARVPAADADRRAADLLKQNLHSLPRGAREVTVTEWTEEGPRPVRIALDPALAPRAQVDRLYRRYRRIVESAAQVEARVAEVRRRLDALTVLLAGLEAPGASLPRIERAARALGAAPRRAAAARPARRRDEEPLPPYRAFRSRAGLPILVGKGAAENDELTVRVARGSDLWLHARGRPGAHVVVRLAKGGAPDQESLLDAAHLAAHFSDAKGEAAPEVVYTRAKWVRKVRGSAPGAVTYSQERAIAVRLEPERIRRLLAGEGEGGPEGEDA